MRLKKWTWAWKIRLIQKRTPVWITVMPNGFPPSREWRGTFFGNGEEHFARITGTHNCVAIDLSLSFPRRRESIKARPEQVFLRCFKLFLWLHFGLEVCKVIRHVSPKTCKFNTNNSAIFPYRSIWYCFIQGGLNIIRSPVKPCYHPCMFIGMHESLKNL